MRGDASSLERLRDAVLQNTRDLTPLLQLSLYYSNLNAHEEAARVLIDGAVSLSPILASDAKRTAAEQLVLAGQTERARELLFNLTRTNIDEARRFAVLSLSNLAKKQSDQYLESTLLEWALKLNPADSDVRFRLAYLYSEMDRPRLSVFHYRICLVREDRTAQNNLGVAFGALQLAGKKIEMLNAASSEFALAKANLAHVYINGGFLDRGETLAREAVEESQGGDDVSIRGRAVEALKRVKDQRVNERAAEERIISDGEKETNFRARYGEASCERLEGRLTGTFSTPYGELNFESSETLIIGTATTRREVSASLAMLFKSFPSVSSPNVLELQHVRFEAYPVGRAGRFRVEITTQEQSGEITVPKSSASHEGLIVLDRDAVGFEGMEEKTAEVSMFRVIRKANS